MAAALSKVIMVEHPAALPARSIRQPEKSAFPASNSRSAFQTVSASGTSSCRLLNSQRAMSASSARVAA